MGNCLGCGDDRPNVVIVHCDVYNDYSTTKNGPQITTVIKKEPTYTSNQLYEVSERRGKSRRGGRPMITEA